MKCEICKRETDDEFRHAGKLLCEDCYIDMASQPKACDPWAVHNAQSEVRAGAGALVTPLQEKILQVVKESGGLTRDDLAARVELTLTDLERELAVLRHMEKIKGRQGEGKPVITVW